MGHQGLIEVDHAHWREIVFAGTLGRGNEEKELWFSDDGNAPKRGTSATDYEF